ncbi:hypothetical protein [Gilvibacter sediminis]|uniref:hypothetical protein n=1 Tax=Gilvibacter sediminis TaxID=379071 RepID=UPI002350CFEB|nr:hypothetical protein [Gilvibacter sediminis]MDC7996518.1 hypothetical protein [Gilvibacter sediminis]
MDLKTLLDNASWDSSELSYTSSSLKADIRKKTEAPMLRVLGNSKRAIILNCIFFVAFIVVYFMVPNTITLLAVGLVVLCYLSMISSLVYARSTLKAPNLNQDIKGALQDIIRYDAAINAFQCNYFSWIITTAYAGGFLLGLGIKGRTLSELIEKWPLLIFWVVGGIAIFYLSKTKGFRRFNRSMNPSYFNSKDIIKTQLQLLNEEENEME